jgi:UDP-N-acetylmuramate dehydrogenase
MKQLFKPYQEITHYNEPIARHTSFRIGGPAEVFVTPQHNDQILEIYQLCLKEGLPVFILGNGTNILVRDEGVKGVVLRINTRQIQMKDDIIVVDAGYPLSHLLTRCLDTGLTGLESMAGIPGSVGGAVVMNAGGKYGNIGDIVSFVKVIKRKNKHAPSDTQCLTLSKSQLKFGYRSSNLKDKFIVLGATIQLEHSTPGQVKALFQEILAEKDTGQPLAAKSAGCIFKNPPGKLTAGQLIEKAGLKGTRIGNALISPKHANFIVNAGNATAQDVLKLVDLIQKTVYERFGVRLDLEIEIW